MMFRNTMMTALAAFALAGAAQAQTAVDANDYVMKAGAADQYEIQSSQLVMDSKDPATKGFANQMVKDHMKSTAMVKKAAMKAGMTPGEPMLDADGQQMLSALQAANGSERDKLYMQQQMAAHDKALALHSDYAAHGDSKPLKSAAALITPVVRKHGTMLKNMAPK